MVRDFSALLLHCVQRQYNQFLQRRLISLTILQNTVLVIIPVIYEIYNRHPELLQDTRIITPRSSPPHPPHIDCSKATHTPSSNSPTPSHPDPKTYQTNAPSPPQPPTPPLPLHLQRIPKLLALLPRNQIITSTMNQKRRCPIRALLHLSQWTNGRNSAQRWVEEICVVGVCMCGLGFGGETVEEDGQGLAFPVLWRTMRERGSEGDI